MYAYVDYYRALDAERPDYDLNSHHMLLLGLTVFALVTGLAMTSLPVMAIAGILAVATGASMQTSIVKGGKVRSDDAEHRSLVEVR